VFITRKPDPLLNVGDDIGLEDWREHALHEGDFRVPDAADLAEAGTPVPDVQRVLVWTGHSQHPRVWFEWVDGQVEAKYLDEATIVRMQEMAAKLGARVISEQGEVFDAMGNHAGFALDPNRPLPAPSGGPPWRKPSLWNRLFRRSGSGK
jgi:hypothetical protein